MPRIARVVVPGIPHHMTQRGNYGQIVFREDEEREQYLQWIKEYGDSYSLKVWAYSLMDNHVHLYGVVRYVENNSVRAGLVRRAEDYPWSSALSHVEGIKDPILSDDFPLLKEIADWREYLSISDNEVLVEELRRCTLTGRPSGDKSFVKRIEKQLDRSLLAQPRGRPRKKRKSK